MFKYNYLLTMMSNEFKQKHSVAGHTYKKVCSRGCVKIVKQTPWASCECTRLMENANKINSMVKSSKNR